jgi:hypothetical protein
VYFQAPLFYELTKSSRKREGNTRLHDGVSRFLPLLSLEKGRNLMIHKPIIWEVV